MNATRRRLRWWGSVSGRMMLGTSLLLLMVVGAFFHIHRLTTQGETAAQVERDAAMAAKLVLRSFEAVDPGVRPVHTGYLARNLVELRAIHNIQVISADGSVAYTHHSDEVGVVLDRQRDTPCTSCHVVGQSTIGEAEFLSREGAPLHAKGFAIPNAPGCRRCHDDRFEHLGMLLVSLELAPYEDDMRRTGLAFAGAALASLLVALLSIGVLFSRLVRRPLARVHREIGKVQRGAFDELREPEGADEMARLHRALYGMAGRLGEAQMQLQERVRERSKEVGALSEELEVLYSNLMHLEHLSAMGTLSAQMAHEIRTPLNALALQLQLLDRGLRRAEAADPALLTLAEEASTEIERIVTILDVFMSRVRRPDAGRRPERLGDVVESVAFLMRAEARRRRVRLISEVEDMAKPREIEGNLVRQVLTNLVSNGIEATSPGGTVRVRATAHDARSVHLLVEDDGPGVPADLRDRIFEPFYTTRSDGTGLGLPIVQRLLYSGGGELNLVDSALGGAAFEVRLPSRGNADHPGGET